MKRETLILTDDNELKSIKIETDEDKDCASIEVNNIDKDNSVDAYICLNRRQSILLAEFILTALNE